MLMLLGMFAESLLILDNLVQYPIESTFLSIVLNELGLLRTRVDFIALI